MQTIRPGRLTVLNYHRVVDPRELGPNSDHSLVSADTVRFTAQMDLVRRFFDVIGSGDLLAWLAGRGTLPDHPMLITFDDGYRDNYQVALPVLRNRDLPAVVFVASDCIENRRPFYWDLAAYCFNHTGQSSLAIPNVGRFDWTDEKECDLCRRGLLQALKQLPEQQKRRIVEQLPQALNVDVPDDAFSDLYMDWEQVRALTAAGVDIGGHTRSHPILSRIPLDQAHREISESKQRIEAEIGKPLRLFAYPNGRSEDFNTELEQLVKNIGFNAAFSLIPGPVSLKTVRKNPFSIRRIYISRNDTLPRFIAKLLGAGRLLRR